MPDPTEINPESAVLRQMDGQWQKIAMLVIYKLVGTAKVTITHKDIEEFQKAWGADGPTLLTHGHSDSFDLQIIDKAAALRIAEYDATMKGTA